MKKLIYFLFIITSLVACSKDDDPVDSKPVLKDCTYMKVRVGTKFTSKVGSQQKTNTVTGLTTKNGLEYVEFINSDNQKSYAYCNGEKYIIGVETPVLIVDNVPTTVQTFALTFDLGASIGEEKSIGNISTTITQGGQSFTSSTRYAGKVTAKGLTKTVGGTQYSNVVEFEMDTYNELEFTGEIHSTNTVYYFAPEVGTISSKVNNLFSGEVTEQELVKYEY